MNPEVKKRWIEALRSGEYHQGYGCMHDANHNMCCLGVLTDLYLKDNNLEWEHSVYDRDYEFEGELCYPPPSVRKWADLGTSNPALYTELEEGEECTFTAEECNDFKKFDFNKIADLIEEAL